MAALPVFTKEDVNYIRLQLLVFRIGSGGLRVYFDSCPLFTPSALQLTLQSNHVKLYKSGKVTAFQWDLLFPPSGDTPKSSDFDVTLLVLLLRNIGGFLPPGCVVWDELPVSNDIAIYHDIARLKYYRNKYAHTLPSINDADFLQDWKVIEGAILRIIPAASHVQYTSSIKALLTQPLSQDDLARKFNEIKNDIKASRDESNNNSTDIQNKLDLHKKVLKDKMDFSTNDIKVKMQISLADVKSNIGTSSANVKLNISTSSDDVKDQIRTSTDVIKDKVETSTSDVKEMISTFNDDVTEMITTCTDNVKTLRIEKQNGCEQTPQHVPSSTDSSGIIDLLCKRLKKRYKDMYMKSQPVPYDGVPSMFDVTSKLYMDLDCTPLDLRCKIGEAQNRDDLEMPDESTGIIKAKMEKYMKVETTENITHLLTSDYNPERLPILIEADAGVGKTTLLRRLVLNWTNGHKDMDKFKLVFLIPLRSVRSNKLEDIICDDLKLMMPEHKEDLKKCLDLWEDEILFLLDGLDEVKLGDECDLQKLMNGTGRHVFCSSRPILGEKTHYSSKIVCVKLLGFSIEALVKFIHLYVEEVHDRNNTQNTADQILAECEKHFFCKSLMRIPLYVGILCYLWDKETGKLPDTATQLFNQFLMEVLNSYVERYTDLPKKCKNKLHQMETGKVTFSRSPLEHSVPAAIRRLLKSIAQLAYKTLVQGEIVFSLDAVSSCVLSLNDIIHIGLFAVEGDGSVIYFRHKLFHEYFAGLYLTFNEEEIFSLFDNRRLDKILSRSHILQNAFFFAGGISDNAYKQMLFCLGRTKIENNYSSVYSVELFNNFRQGSKTWRRESLGDEKDPLTTSFYLQLYFEKNNNANTSELKPPEMTTIPVHLASVHSLAAAFYVLKMQQKEESTYTTPKSLLLIDGPVIDIDQLISILDECNSRPDITHIRLMEAGMELLSAVLTLKWDYIRGMCFEKCQFLLPYDHLVASFPNIEGVLYDHQTWKKGKVVVRNDFDKETSVPQDMNLMLFVQQGREKERQDFIELPYGSVKRYIKIGVYPSYDWSLYRGECLPQGITGVCIEIPKGGYCGIRGPVDSELQQCVKDVSYLKSIDEKLPKTVIHLCNSRLFISDGFYLNQDSIKCVLHHYNKKEEVNELVLTRAGSTCMNAILSVEWPYIETIKHVDCEAFLEINYLAEKFPNLVSVDFDLRTQQIGKPVLKEGNNDQNVQVIMHLPSTKKKTRSRLQSCDICIANHPTSRCIFVSLLQEQAFIEKFLAGTIKKVCTLERYYKIETIDKESLSKIQREHLTYFHARYDATKPFDDTIPWNEIKPEDRKYKESDVQMYMALSEENRTILQQKQQQWQTSISFLDYYSYREVNFIEGQQFIYDWEGRHICDKIHYTYDEMKDLCSQQEQSMYRLKRKAPRMKERHEKDAHTSSQWIEQLWKSSFFKLSCNDKTICFTFLSQETFDVTMTFRREI